MVLGVFSLVFSGVHAASANGTYTVTDLGPGMAYGINASGTIVGRGGNGCACIFANGTTTSLGKLGGSSSWAYGVNAAGQIVGKSDTSAGYAHAVLWTGGAIQDLGALNSGFGSGSIAYGINSAGHVVGTSTPGSKAFLWTNGVMQDLGTLGGSFGSVAYDVNDSGQIVGYSGVNSGGFYHAFLNDGTMHDLGTAHGHSSEWSQASAINAAGKIVGTDGDGNGFHAFLYSAGAMQDIGALPGRIYSSANDINVNGQVVGFSSVSSPDSTNTHAFIYAGGVMADLNTLIDSNAGWTLIEATAINDSGWIVGYGATASGSHAFLLTPVPEPGNIALLASGMIAGLIWRRWRV
jgi:probable HAF family extracellular repeat protein